MKNFSIILSTVAIILATVAIVKVYEPKTPTVAPAAIFAAPDASNEAAVVATKDDVMAVLTEKPEIIAQAMEKYQQQQAEAEQKAAEERMAKYAGEISNEADVPFIGPKDAKVTVTEFFDFSCGYCKRLSPEIEKLIADNADVKFVFKPLTFVSPTSAYQAKAGFAAHNQGKFLEYYKAIMGGNANSEELVDEAAKATGIDMEKYKSEATAKDTAVKLGNVSEFAQKIGINGVPAVFVNGKQVYARTAGELQEAINKAATAPAEEPAPVEEVAKAEPATPAEEPAVKVSKEAVLAVLTEKPEIIAQAMDAYQRQQAEAEQKAAAERLAKYADEISSEENVPFIGPKDAKVTVTEFFDFSCGHCKHLSPEIEKLVANNADVKFVFKPLTFVSPTSVYQAKAGFAAHNQGKFLEYYKAVMEGNAGSEELVDEAAKKSGLDFGKYKMEVAAEDTAVKLGNVAAFAQKIGVNGVPAVFINGKQVNARTADELQKAIDAAK